MPSSLNKVTKSISKKRQAKKGKSTSLNALHENSRDAARIRRAAARDEKVTRSEKERRGRDERYLNRIAYLHSLINLPPSALALTLSTSPSPPPSSSDAMETDHQRTFPLPTLHALIQLYLSRHDALLAEVRGERRPGRPKSARQVALEHDAAEEQAEYDSGFWVVDLRDEANVRLFREWRGQWGALGTLKFVRVARPVGGKVGNEDEAEEGACRPSGFPPTGVGN